MQMLLKGLCGQGLANILGGEQLIPYHFANIFCQFMAFGRNDSWGQWKAFPKDIPRFKGPKEHLNGYLIGEIAD